MKTLSSLENRVFLACAFVAVLSIALGTHFVTVRVSSEAEADLHRGLEQAAELLSDHHASRTETLTRMAWLIADLPKLKAAVATGDAPTVLPVAAEYRERVGSDVMVIRDGDGRVLASLGTDAAAWDEGAAFQGTAAGFLQIVTVPITIGLEPAEELGILSLGFFLNAELALELGELTQSEVVLRSDERVIATTVTEELVEAEDYVSTEVPLVEDGPVATLLRSRKERLSFLSTFREGLLLSALFGILLAIVLSYGVARTVTRPLLAITEAMSEMTSTGDLARKIELRGRWIDADATVLARAFNRLTESIARFQREAASRERLSALGRVSTVIAHPVARIPDCFSARLASSPHCCVSSWVARLAPLAAVAYPCSPSVAIAVTSIATVLSPLHQPACSFVISGYLLVRSRFVPCSSPIAGVLLRRPLLRRGRPVLAGVVGRWPRPLAFFWFGFAGFSVRRNGHLFPLLTVPKFLGPVRVVRDAHSAAPTVDQGFLHPVLNSALPRTRLVRFLQVLRSRFAALAQFSFRRTRRRVRILVPAPARVAPASGIGCPADTPHVFLLFRCTSRAPRLHRSLLSCLGRSDLLLLLQFVPWLSSSHRCWVVRARLSPDSS